MFQKKDNITVPSHGAGKVEIVGLSEESYEKLMVTLHTGAYHVRVVNGKLIAIPIWESLPSPTKDEDMEPFWRKESYANKQTLLYDEIPLDMENMKRTSPSIIISSLCGYNYTKERYKEEAVRLESFGFECMRSKRGLDGKFWENWCLAGLWSAKGELEKSISGIQNEQAKLRTALEFIRVNCSFGSLDVCHQRLCMANPE